MKLVPTDTPLDPPGICCLCEASPQREIGEQVVDTEYQTQRGTRLAGRKYVCEKCIVGLNSALNLPFPEDD